MRHFALASAGDDRRARQGHALCDLAEVLEVARRRDEAAVPLEEALERYQSKEVIPLARRLRERLAELQPV